MQESMTQTSVPPAGSYSPWRGLIDVFINPSRLGKALSAKPHWLIPAIFVVSASIVAFFLTQDLTIQFSQEQMRNLSSKGIQVPNSEEIVEKSQRYGALEAALWGIALTLLTAFIVMIVGSFGFGLKTNFSRVYSSTAYSGWLFAFGGLVYVPFFLLSGNLGFTISPAVILESPKITDPMWIVLSKFSLFHIWEAIALSFMAAEIFQTTRNKGVAIAIISLGIITSTGVGFSLLLASLVPS